MSSDWQHVPKLYAGLHGYICHWEITPMQSVSLKKVSLYTARARIDAAWPLRWSYLPIRLNFWGSAFKPKPCCGKAMPLPVPKEMFM